jgi:hypothetical protein
MTMQSFAEVFDWAEGEDLEGRTILFGIKDWYLYTFTGGGAFYYAHGCDESRGGFRWRGTDRGMMCNSCKSKPPDEFTTVAVLAYDGRDN